MVLKTSLVIVVALVSFFILPQQTFAEPTPTTWGCIGCTPPQTATPTLGQTSVAPSQSELNPSVQAEATITLPCESDIAPAHFGGKKDNHQGHKPHNGLFLMLLIFLLELLNRLLEQLGANPLPVPPTTPPDVTPTVVLDLTPTLALDPTITVDPSVTAEPTLPTDPSPTQGPCAPTTGATVAPTLGGATLPPVTTGPSTPPLLTTPLTCQSMPVLLFVAPNTSWDTVRTSLPTVPIMVVNPANGPGTSADATYVAAIAKAKSAGMKVLGYITSAQNTKPNATLNAEVDSWISLYNVKDFYIDQMNATPENFPYYSEFWSATRNKNAIAQMIWNTGTTPIQDYMALPGFFVNYQGDSAGYFSATFPSWVSTYAANRFYHIIYGVNDAATMQQVLARSKQSNAGNVYISSDSSWNTLPSYFATEVAQIKQGCPQR